METKQTTDDEPSLAEAMLIFGFLIGWGGQEITHSLRLCKMCDVLRHPVLFLMTTWPDFAAMIVAVLILWALSNGPALWGERAARPDTEEPPFRWDIAAVIVMLVAFWAVRELCGCHEFVKKEPAPLRAVSPPAPPLSPSPPA